MDAQKILDEINKSIEILKGCGYNTDFTDVIVRIKDTHIIEPPSKEKNEAELTFYFKFKR